MKRKDVILVKTCDSFPEQYDAYGPYGKVIGYVRIRWGFCCAWCPDAGANDEVYASKISFGCGGFGNKWSRRIHLWAVRGAISKWWNQNEVQTQTQRT